MPNCPRAQRYRIQPPSPFRKADRGKKTTKGDAVALAPYTSQTHSSSVSLTPTYGHLEELDAISREGLDPALLREARHLARNKDLQFLNDLDAVRVLRASGTSFPISQASRHLAGARNDALFAPTDDGLPGQRLEQQNMEDLGKGFIEFQKTHAKVAHRRRKATIGFASRLLTLVVGPTAVVGLWMSIVASPIYTSHSEFTVKSGSQTQTSSMSAGLAGMSGGGMTNDNIMLQDYLTSRTAFHELEKRMGFRDFFRGPNIDPLTAIGPKSDEEDIYRDYLKHVKIAFTPTEGVIRMTVSTPLPGASFGISRTLLDMARTHVNDITQVMRDSQVKYAQKAVDAEMKLLAKSQADLISAQLRHDTLSPDVELKLVEQQISPLMTELADERVKISMIKANERPNPSQLATSQRRIDTIQSEIDSIRNKALAKGSDKSSLAAVSADIETAKSEVKTHQQILAKLTDQLVQARQEASRASMYVAVAVQPMRPASHDGPDPIEKTFVVFLVLLVAYAAGALTLSLVREQVAR